MTKLHLQISSSEVACGEKMAHWKENPTGWDLSTVTVEPADVTCPDCKATFSRSATKREL